MTVTRWNTDGVEIGRRTALEHFVPESDECYGKEWRALELLAERAPGLAPKPLECGTDDSGGFIRMPPVTQQAGVIAQLRRWQANGQPAMTNREVYHALHAGLAWLDDHLACDGQRALDFEDSGRSDRAYEIAEITRAGVQLACEHTRCHGVRPTIEANRHRT